MVYEAVFEEIGFWPLKLHIPTVAGYAIWALGKEKDDLLLGLDNNLLLFNTSKALTKFLINDISCNLSNLPNFENLKAHFNNEVQSKAFLRLYDPYDFVSLISDMIGTTWSAWSIELSQHVLNHFNMIWDIAKTIGDDWITSGMLKKTKVGTFLDILTFITETDLPRLDAFDKNEIVDFYDESLKRISARTLLICK